eukprot:6725083-Pyramimonas_sp.AAC.1
MEPTTLDSNAGLQEGFRRGRAREPMDRTQEPKCRTKLQHLLRKMHSGQTATVRTDTTSRLFNLQRGTKQGDPL